MQTLEAQFWMFLLALFRFAPLLIVPSISPFTWAPTPARLSLLIATCFLSQMTISAISVPLPDSLLQIGILLIAEFGIGLVLAFSVHLVFGALHFFGRLLDMQIGLGAAGIFNPTIGNMDTLMSTALVLIGTMLFFTLGFYALLFRGLAASLEIVPLGSGFALHGGERIISLIGSEFMLGFGVVAPVVIVLFLLDVMIAFASRMMPQVNIYFISLPLKIGLGLICISISLRYIGPAVGHMFQDAFDSWQGILGT